MDDIAKTIFEKYSSKMDYRFEYHNREENLNIQCSEYSKKRRLALSKFVLSKTRIYLDIKYWIYLRDAYCGRPQKNIHNEIASCLYQLVELGRVICPANWTILNEILKQTDPQSRSITCKIVDDLSQKVILEPSPLLLDIELTHLVSSFLSGKENNYNLNQLVWGNAGNILGQSIPRNSAFDHITENAIQKTYLDMMNELSFSEIAQVYTPLGDYQDFCDTPEHARERTIETNNHRSDFNTFQEVYEIELYGLLDEIKDGISSVFEYLYKKKTGGDISQEERNDTKSIKQFINMIVYAYKHGKLNVEFPQLHIGSSIHATVRYKNMPFKKGDFYDFFHASSAIPYCNYFFTEKKLANILTQKPLNLDKTYGCIILHREEDILEELKKIR